jgi:hypothetical protein
MSPQDQVATLILAALFRGARMIHGTPCSAKEAFDQAEAFIKEGKQRGIDLENLK